mmetsp:Transcript_3281/g.9818  ORF Transcript_3281/g.9818 Transcript_3281/m.9818 type:complete len:108 (+) Transcript_3281:1065-1388(+)
MLNLGQSPVWWLHGHAASRGATATIEDQLQGAWRFVVQLGSGAGRSRGCCQPAGTGWACAHWPVRAAHHEAVSARSPDEFARSLPPLPFEGKSSAISSKHQWFYFSP